MALPFTHDAFLMFGHNTTLWPMVVLLWLATVKVAWPWIRRGEVSSPQLFECWPLLGLVGPRLPLGLLPPDQSGGPAFAAAFAVEAVLLGWLAATSRGPVVAGTTRRRIIGNALVLRLAYPLLGFVFGLTYPRLPLFAVPCPTTLVTAGWLIASGRIPRVSASSRCCGPSLAVLLR